jgi:hypothetical protein
MSQNRISNFCVGQKRERGSKEEDSFGLGWLRLHVHQYELLYVNLVDLVERNY